jgi:hypothetical protein
VTTMVMAVLAATPPAVGAVGVDGARVDECDGGVHGPHTASM